MRDLTQSTSAFGDAFWKAWTENMMTVACVTTSVLVVKSTLQGDPALTQYCRIESSRRHYQVHV